MVYFYYSNVSSLVVLVNLDLDTPITKVIKIIRDIQENSGLSAENMDNLDYVVEILSSNQLFLPNFLHESAQGLDGDVSKWLNNMVLNQTIAPEIYTQSSDQLLLGTGDELMEVLVKDIHPYNTSRSKHYRNENNIDKILSKADSWDFDIFALAAATNGRPLYHLGLYVFEKLNLRQTWQIEDSTLRKFLTLIEDGYRKNPYHNSTHAADVMHAVYFFLTQLGLENVVNSEEVFASLVAAAIHDYDHPGQTNAFLINTSNPLALMYNDSAVLEHYHCASSFVLILDEKNECNIFSKVS
jgi:hypothetical protein